MPNVEEQKQPWLRPELIASWWEIVLVLLLMDALWIETSSRAAWHILHGTYFYHYFTAFGHLRVAGLQTMTLAAMFLFLHRRGWKTADLGIRPSWEGCGQAFVLTILMLFGSRVAGIMLHDVLHALQVTHVPFAPLRGSGHPHPSPIPLYGRWVILLLALVINACSEEIVYLSYGFNQIAAKSGPAVATVLTILLRMTCHTYHGIYIVGNVATFLITSLWYWRTRNLWAVIGAHALFDLVAEMEGGAPGRD